MAHDSHITSPQKTTTQILAKLRKPTKHHTKNIPFTGENIVFNPVRGEAALWVAVITQAMMDALSRSQNKEAQYHKHEAIRWLTENGKDFAEVCLNAGMNPDDVRRKAKKAIANPTLWRAEAGTGKRYVERKTYREKQKLKLKLRKEGVLMPVGHESVLPSAIAQVITGPWA